LREPPGAGRRCDKRLKGLTRSRHCPVDVTTTPELAGEHKPCDIGAGIAFDHPGAQRPQTIAENGLASPEDAAGRIGSLQKTRDNRRCFALPGQSGQCSVRLVGRSSVLIDGTRLSCVTHPTHQRNLFVPVELNDAGAARAGD
jgi:hypothetical protein